MRVYECQWVVSPVGYSIRDILHRILSKIQGVRLGASKPKVDLTAIGSRIRGLRGEIRQEVLAAYLRIRQGQLSKIETGKTAPTLEVLTLLSDKFHKSIDWIVRGERHE